MQSEAPVTRLLRESREGSQEAMALLLPLVYSQLHSIAAHHLRGERSGHTLSPTALVNEAYMKFAGAAMDVEDRKHFFALASLKMRQILVDHARTRQRHKRGGELERCQFDELNLADPANPALVLELDDALNQLAKQDERKARVVELIYFGGLTYDEVAGVLSISAATVHTDLRMAKAWLRSGMSGTAGHR
jgi:RNA polymerase sigma factor (TIGR02999 family)